MKSFLKSFCILILFFMSSCVYLNHHSKDIPSDSEFKYKETRSYGMNKQRSIDLNIDSCLSRVEILVHDEEHIKIEKMYNSEEVKERILVMYSDEHLNIYTKEEQFVLCHKASDIDSYIRITLPSHLIHLDVKVNAFDSNFNATEMQINHLSYVIENGEFTLKQTTVNDLNVKMDKGKVNLLDITGEISTIYLTSGLISVYNCHIYDIIDLKLQKGDLELKNIQTNKLLTNVTVGDTLASDLDVYLHIEMINEQGVITLNNVYSDNVYLSVINGDIYYHNENKSYYIYNLKYSLFCGETQFNINGSIIKI